MIDATTGADFDSVIKNADMKSIYEARREKVFAYMREHSIAATIFHDSEDSRDCSVRYLTGHPSDAVLVLTADGKSVLSPWDENLASQKAHASSLIPYTDFNRDPFIAVQKILAQSKHEFSTVALPPSTTHLDFKKYEATLAGFKLECLEDSVHSKVIEMRAQKDEYEIACTRKACAITSAMTDIIEEKVKSGEFKLESDVALFIEKELRNRGCERTSFDTLAAGPSRSYAIHAFPGWTGGSWGTDGLSILDYGVCFEGYASDCTITIAKGVLSKAQEEILFLVQKAANECLPLYAPGKKIHDASQKAADVFAEAEKFMPHGLGHGTGLQIHEAPFVSQRSKEDAVFKAGNIITLEPGLYDISLGGCRLENDVLITDTGNCVLTNSRIIRI
ncbi:MAG: Xaa-Pro peptidase family protein [Treponema sp.]|nr:Xaa-Pro peptidase family protein [Treponema sp.]